MSPKPSTRATQRRAAIYVRISKDKREQAGVRRQERECRELAARLGWEIVVVYADNDIEASSGKPRPAYLQMIDDMRAGRINAVVGWHSDRIYRIPAELEDLIKIADAHDVLFAAVKVGTIDLSTASGRLVARLLGAVSKHETELKGERQSAQLKQRAQDGLPTGGGSRPFGWETGGMKVRPAEKKVLLELVDRALSGESVGALTEWLTASGVPSVSGKPWHPTVVRRLLMNPRLAALSTWEGEIIGPAQWEPIIDEPTFRRLREVLTYRGPGRANTSRVALLPGLVWCGPCGYELVTFRQQRNVGPPGIRSYGCRTRYMPGRPGHLESCGRISIKAEALEDDIAERLIAELFRPRSRAKLEAARRRKEGTVEDDAAAQLGEAEERLRELGIDYAKRRIGRTEFLAARDHLDAEIKELQRTAGATVLDVPVGDLKDFAAWWEDAALAHKVALLQQRIDRIDVGPHRGSRAVYDPTRVTVSWR